MPYKANEARRHRIPRARYRVANWPEYDRALQHRGSLTVWVTPEALAAWHPPRTGRRGRSPHYADIAIETGHLLRLAFGRPWRQTEGLLRSLVTLLGVGVGIPDHTTVSRRSPGLALASSLARANGPVHVVIDATGLKVYGAGEWRVEKHGARTRRGWRKLVWGSPCQAFIAGTPIRCVVLPSVAGRRGGCGGRRGARQLRCVSSRRELVFGRPRGTRTMMQPCASAAKLRGGGPILHRGSAAMPALGSPPPRTVIGGLPRERGGAPKLVARECVRSSRSRRAQDEALRHLARGRQLPQPDEQLPGQRHDQDLARAGAGVR